MRSNIDVSRRLHIVNEEPTYESKKRVAMELINEIIDYKSFETIEEDKIEANILEEKITRAEKNAMTLLKSKFFNKMDISKNEESEKKNKSSDRK